MGNLFQRRNHDCGADGITERAFGTVTTIRWADVERIRAVKLDKITYQEDFLVLEDVHGNSISVGELDKEFGICDREIRRSFSMIPESWRSFLQAQESDDVVLWERGLRRDHI